MKPTFDSNGSQEMKTPCSSVVIFGNAIPVYCQKRQCNGWDVAFSDNILSTQWKSLSKMTTNRSTAVKNSNPSPAAVAVFDTDK